MDRIREVNIRATADETFWGREYEESLYLWEFSKHNLTLRSFSEIDANTLDDPFPSTQSIQNAHDFCREHFYRQLDVLHDKLNQIHGLDLPKTFWRTALGSWLYRHISICYDKFVCLQRIALDQTSITLLSPDSYYTPNDHFDHIFYFCNDPGVMQLASEYYALFADKKFKTMPFSIMPNAPYFGSSNAHASLIIDKENLFSNASRDKDNTIKKVVLCSAYYSQSVLNRLFEQSQGEICDLTLPKVSTHERPLNSQARKLLSQPSSNDPFDKYLSKTLEYCMPRILIEHFNDYHETYSRHAENNPLRALVTECWISFIPLSIYCAIARHLNSTRLIFQHHGANNQFQFCNLLWIEKEVADSYITTGSKDDESNCVVGGFAIKERIYYEFADWKSDIVHATTTRFPYLCTCGTSGYAGKRFLSYLQGVDEVIKGIPDRLKKHYVLRPRRDQLFLDTEHLLNVGNKGIRIDTNTDFSTLIQNSRLVIIDHMSTGLAEIAANRIPFFYLYNDEFELLSDEHSHLFDNLISCGVVHKSVNTLIEHLDRIYDDVRGWWDTKSVQCALDGFISHSLGDPELTINYLLSLLPGSETAS